MTNFNEANTVEAFVCDLPCGHLPGSSEASRKVGLQTVQTAIESLLRPNIILDILAQFTLFATDRKKRRLKIVCCYQ